METIVDGNREMLRVRNVKLRDCDQPSVELDEFSTELHEYDFDKISMLLTVMANELATDHHRYNIARDGLTVQADYE